MKILTSAEMARLDRLTSERYGVPSLALMENAGRGVLEFLAERFAPLDGQSIVILCGRGNNGGDGMVVARLLRERGVHPAVILLAPAETLKGDAAEQIRRLESGGAPEVISDSEAWRRARSRFTSTTLLVDAMFGTGLNKPLEGFYREVVRDIPAAFARARIVAVDLPSGVSADYGELVGDAVRADFSVTFTAPKRAHVFSPASEYAGEWVVKDIGTPREALEGDPGLFLNLTTLGDVDWIAQPRPRNAHKGHFGHVLVIGGSVGKAGAAAMTAKAALRTGAGLVTVATAASVLPVVASFAMEVMTAPLPETPESAISLRALESGALDRLAEGKTVLAVGPGAGTSPETSEFVRKLANRFDLPMVLDADGLNAFEGCAESLQASGRIRILTPHPGEMSRLTGRATRDVIENAIELAREFARKRSVCLVLKGHRTLTAAPDGQVWVNPTGNPGMATGGSGDVLTGITAGLLAQFRDAPAERVAAAAVYLHGLAGDLAASEKGEQGLIAGDILESLPRALQSLAGTGAK